MNTLKKNGEFQNIYNLGNKYFGNYSLIFFNKNKLEYSRFNANAATKGIPYRLFTIGSLPFCSYANKPSTTDFKII